MITLEHIEIYKKYNGDGDGFIRCATSKEKTIMDYQHWSLIDSLVQDLLLIKRGLASVIFIEVTDKKLIENCDNEHTIEALKDINKGLD